jgi:hypothetical protein
VIVGALHKQFVVLKKAIKEFDNLREKLRSLTEPYKSYKLQLTILSHDLDHVHLHGQSESLYDDLMRYVRPSCPRACVYE